MKFLVKITSVLSRTIEATSSEKASTSAAYLVGSSPQNVDIQVYEITEKQAEEIENSRQGIPPNPDGVVELPTGVS